MVDQRARALRAHVALELGHARGARRRRGADASARSVSRRAARSPERHSHSMGAPPGAPRSPSATTAKARVAAERARREPLRRRRGRATRSRGRARAPAAGSSAARARGSSPPPARPPRPRGRRTRRASTGSWCGASALAELGGARARARRSKNAVDGRRPARAPGPAQRERRPPARRASGFDERAVSRHAAPEHARGSSPRTAISSRAHARAGARRCRRGSAAAPLAEALDVEVRRRRRAPATDAHAT